MIPVLQMKIEEPPPGTKVKNKPAEQKKVFISHVDTPGAIFIQTADVGKDGLDKWVTEYFVAL